MQFTIIRVILQTRIMLRMKMASENSVSVKYPTHWYYKNYRNKAEPHFKESTTNTQIKKIKLKNTKIDNKMCITSRNINFILTDDSLDFWSRLWEGNAFDKMSARFVPTSIGAPSSLAILISSETEAHTSII